MADEFQKEIKDIEHAVERMGLGKTLHVIRLLANKERSALKKAGYDNSVRRTKYASDLISIAADLFERDINQGT